MIYSSASKLSAAGSESWTQSTRGIAGKAEHGDLFGTTLAAGNFTGSSRDDLAISAITEEFSGRKDLGSVTVLKGSSSGLTAKGSQVWSQKQLGAGNETADRLGETLVAADFGRNPDGTVRGDLVIGSRPGYGEPTPRAYLLYGSNAGLGQVQIIEHGSGAFAAADFNTKVGAEGRYADLARVNQNETVGDSFSLEIFAGSATGLPTAKSQSIPLSAARPPRPTRYRAAAPAERRWIPLMSPNAQARTIRSLTTSMWSHS